MHQKKERKEERGEKKGGGNLQRIDAQHNALPAGAMQYGC